MATDIPIILPSLNPTEQLLEVISGIRELCPNRIVVVDDGSKEECQPIFQKAAKIDNVTLLRHAVNQGKGRALKTAFNYYLNTNGENAIGVVTADADGQHRPEDIIHCLRELELHPDRLVLGCRCFNSNDVPWKSKFGNKLTILAFRFLGGSKVSDTQTGLRGVPASLMRVLLSKNSGERFEFETVMLLECRKLDSVNGYYEVPIETVYVNDNRGTHFNPLVDSFKIYRVLLNNFIGNFIAFVCSALLSAIIDQGVFAALFYWVLAGMSERFRPLLLSVVAARIISLLFNYSVNKKLVFSHKGRLFDAKPFLSYLSLCIIVLMTSYLLLKGAIAVWPSVNVLCCKIIIDTLLFLCNYNIQKNWCFSRREKRGL